jgi:hypothetical protein
MTPAVYTFCARSLGNLPTRAPNDNGLCESRRIESERGYIPHDQEIVCCGCGLLTCGTYGLAGSGLMDDRGRVHPLPATLSCHAGRGAGTMSYWMNGHEVRIKVGPNEPAACVTARLHAAIKAARSERDPIADIMRAMGTIHGDRMAEARFAEEDDEGGVTLYDGTRIPIAWMPRDVFEAMRKDGKR